MTKLLSLFRLVAWTAMLAGVAAMWDGHRLSRGTSPEVSAIIVEADRVYREGHGHAKLDVYLPRDRADRSPPPSLSAAILAIHGGSWVGGSKSEFGPQVARLVQHGFVVFVPDYYLGLAGKPSWPHALEDLREAVRWIRAHSREYKVDPDRIVAMGTSAGGQLAMLLGTDVPEPGPGEVSYRVRAAVSLYGPSDLLELRANRHLANDPLSSLVDVSSSRASAGLAAASPSRHVSSDDAPIFLIHGSDDRWVPPAHSKWMADRLSRAGVKNRLLIVPGARHGFELIVRFPETRDLVPEILAFLQSVWQIPERDHG